MPVKITEPIVLKIRDVAANALKAYEEGRLIFQNVEKLGPLCYYNRNAVSDGGGNDGRHYCCGIGASLPPDIGAALDRANAEWLPLLDGKETEGHYCTSGIADLLAFGVIETDDPDALTRIQTLHDETARKSRDGRAFVDFCKEILARPVEA